MGAEINISKICTRLPSDAHVDSCGQLVASCVEQNDRQRDLPEEKRLFSLPLPSGKWTKKFSGFNRCLKMSRTISKVFGSFEAPKTDTGSDAPYADMAPAGKPSHTSASPRSWMPDGKTKFLKTFPIKTSFLEKEGTLTTPRRTIIYLDGKTIDIAIRDEIKPIGYRLEFPGEDRVVLRYDIAWKDGTSKGTLEFNMSEKLLGLECRITLSSHGKKIESITLHRV